MFSPSEPNVGGADRDRTDDLKLAKLPLSQLSYGPELEFWKEAVVGPDRFELSTPRLSSVCSNQLSYGPAPAAVRAAPNLKHALRNWLANSPASRVSRCSRVLRRRETKTATNRKYPIVRERTQDFVSKPIARICLRRYPIEIVLRKEVIQPQVPLRLPCYDFTPVADPTVVSCLLAVSALPSGRTNSHGVTGGVYKARERIHRGMLIRDY